MRPLIPTLAVLAIALTGCGGNTETPQEAPETSMATTSASPTGTSPTEVEATEDTTSTVTHAIGETVTMGNLAHTLHGARFSQGDEYSAPTAGTRWLVLDIEATNNGDEPTTVSSGLMWTLNDPDNRSVGITYSGDERGSLDAELGPGRSIRGEIAYEVSADHEQWELLFSPELMEYGQAIYEIPAAEVTETAPQPQQDVPESDPASSPNTDTDSGTEDMFTYDEAYAAWEGGMDYYDAFCVNYVPTTDGGVSQCEGIEAGTVDRVTGEYIGG